WPTVPDRRRAAGMRAYRAAVLRRDGNRPQTPTHFLTIIAAESPAAAIDASDGIVPTSPSSPRRRRLGDVCAGRRRPFVRGSAGDGTSVQVAARHGIEGYDSQHETADGEDAHAQRPGRVPRAEL